MRRLTLLTLILIVVGQCAKHTQQPASSADQSAQQTLQSCDFSSYKPLKSEAQSPVISLPRAEYPVEAKEQKLDGPVTVKMLVNLHTGIVERACVASGGAILGKAATDAALKARFSPEWGNNKYLAQRYNYVETQITYNLVAQ